MFSCGTALSLFVALPSTQNCELIEGEDCLFLIFNLLYCILLSVSVFNFFVDKIFGDFLGGPEAKT